MRGAHRIAALATALAHEAAHGLNFGAILASQSAWEEAKLITTTVEGVEVAADAQAHARIGALLRRVWAECPPPEWTQERADRIYASVMATLERRRRRRRALLTACAASAVFVPLLLLFTYARR